MVSHVDSGDSQGIPGPAQVRQLFHDVGNLRVFSGCFFLQVVWRRCPLFGGRGVTECREDFWPFFQF